MTEKTEKGQVYCYMCTHMVEADVFVAGTRVYTRPGQSCPRCHAALASTALFDEQKKAA